MVKQATFWQVRHAPAAWAAVVAGCLLLCGCPSPSDDPPAAVAPALEGYASDGFASFETVAVASSQGRQIAFALEGKTAYRLALGPLQGPYLLRAYNSGEPYHSVAWVPGYRNISRLTDLVLADLFAASPKAVFDAVEAGDSAGDFPNISEAALAASERRVRRMLARRFGLPIPPSIESLFSSPATFDGGDAMTIYQRTLQNRIAAEVLSMAEFVALVAQNGRACRVQALAAAWDGEADEFCPTSRQIEPDPDDSSLTRHRWADAYGDGLTLRLRGDVVDSVEWVRSDLRRVRCDGAACRGITVGAAAPDGSRRFTFGQLALNGAAGALELQGTLDASNEAAVVGGCIADQLVVTAPEGTRTTHCIGRRPVTPRLGRYEHGIQSLTDPNFVLDVVLDEDRAVWVLMATDSFNGASSPLFWRALCVEADCAGIAVSPADASGRRSLRFNQVTLAATDADGNVVPGRSYVIEGSVRTGDRREPVVPGPCLDTEGRAPGVRLRVVVEGAGEQQICDNLSGAQRLVEHDDDADGVTEALSFNVFGTTTEVSGFGATLTLDHLRLADGGKASIVFSDIWINNGGARVYPADLASCSDADCPAGGVVVEGGPGAFTVRLEGLPVPERFINGVPTGRTLRFWTVAP